MPHSIAVDAIGNVYVADRGNRRIQVFDCAGRYLRQITIDEPFDSSARQAIGPKPGQSSTATGTMQAGSPWALCITPGPNQVSFSSDAYPGRIDKLSLDGKVLGYLGESEKQWKQFGWIRMLNWRVQKHRENRGWPIQAKNGLNGPPSVAFFKKSEVPENLCP